jgi:cell division protein FtsB
VRVDVERGVVARTVSTKGRSKRAKKRTPRSRRRFRLVWLTALVALAAYLYYQPLATYFETRNDLAARRAEVETLRITKTSLELRLTNSTSLAATQREARRLGYVLPGEQLFVVKGIPEWRRVQRSLRGGG